MRSAKRTYYYKEFTTFKSDSSKTWKLIKHVIKTPQNESNIQEITVNGRKIIDKDIIAVHTLIKLGQILVKSCLPISLITLNTI